ncbi:MAG: hypothetical protein AMXMBFR53_08220 [Gemmatimonadota bacterium]
MTLAGGSVQTRYMTDRRAFLKGLAKGAVYAAPVIYTLSTPRELMAIITSGMIMMALTADPLEVEMPAAPWGQAPQTTAPWSVSPPWAPPTTSPRPPGGGGGE